MKEDDRNWPEPDRIGCQELEVRRNGEEISFATTKLGNLLQVQQSKDPEGLRIFYYLVQVFLFRGSLSLPVISFLLRRTAPLRKIKKARFLLALMTSLCIAAFVYREACLLLGGLFEPGVCCTD